MNQAELNAKAEKDAKVHMAALIHHMHISGATAVVKKIIIKTLIKRLLDEEIN